MWLSVLGAVVLGAGASATQAHLRFLALGDSYTIGEGVAAHERWPHLLAESLRRAGIKVDMPEIVAHTGWTTDELSAAMDAHAFHAPYALVTLLVGVNNQYRGRDLDNYRTEFRALLERAIALAGGDPHHVIVVSIPDWSVTRFGNTSGRDARQVAREIDAFNAANVEIAQTLHARYVDITGISRERGGEADMLVTDGLHPSAAMYGRWLAAIEPVAKDALAAH